ncbi:MAG: biopolymer transporter ExbD [Rickettsiales bacterium]|jgi:biopolymer transport protein ExbD|nr:biopolymer transporter ExbD [Rickettsiales bacterium]
MLLKKKTIRRPLKTEDSVSLMPFISIFLILAIPFMAARSNNFNLIKVELPRADYKIVSLEFNPIKIIVNAEGSLYVDGNFTQFSNLVSAVHDISLKNFNRNIYVLGDAGSNYGVILRIVNALQASGYRNVNLVSGVYNNFK